MALALLLPACAAPGERPATAEPAPITASRSPAVDTLPCTRAKAEPGRTPTAADVATPRSPGPLPRPSDEYLDEEYRGEMLRRQMEANDAYRERRPLPETALPGAVRCAVKAEDALKPLYEKKVFDEKAVKKALAAAGLPDSAVEKPASRDRAPHDGVIIAAWTGQACIVGYLSPGYGAHVEYGSTIADGGCLPARD
ncbi:DUF6993 domain-containing protein [Actinoplanes subglobosus]|uniref:DUF6993 domain-containing protein n=1 Tax=Actinoplanes subglobosus TaxID=1547892 RepID=A0ABV8IQ63_9ACTN